MENKSKENKYHIIKDVEKKWNSSISCSLF